MTSKKFLYYWLLFLIVAGGLSRAAVSWAGTMYCPPSEGKLQVEGPKSRKSMDGLSVMTCMYSDHGRVGKIEAGLYYDARKPGTCDWSGLGEETIVSQDRQAYVRYSDFKSGDDYGAEFWRDKAGEFLRSVEGNALPCDFTSAASAGLGKETAKVRKDIRPLDISIDKGQELVFPMAWSAGGEGGRDILLVCPDCGQAGLGFSNIRVLSSDLAPYLESLGAEKVSVRLKIERGFIFDDIRGISILQIGDKKSWQSSNIVMF